jgi:hypothetical protein
VLRLDRDWRHYVKIPPHDYLRTFSAHIAFFEAPLQPYVIKQGDHLALLAYKFGFDADTVWNDPQNAQLRQAGHLSKDPNILYPTDMLYIPDQKPPVMTSLTTGATNTFVSTAPTTNITLQISDPTFASQAYAVQELPGLTGLTTDANGTATFSAPVTLETATILFETGPTFVCHIGSLDPVDTLSGVFQRLQCLAYIDADITFDSGDLGLLRGALRALRAAQTGVDSSIAVGPTDSNPAPPVSTDDASQGDSSPASPTSEPLPDDGLADDGTVDEETVNLLITAYGC